MRPESERQATRDALARMRNDGADLSKVHDVDFHVAIETESGAESVATEARRHDFATKVVAEDEGGFTVWCTKSFVPTEPAISEFEELLDEIARPHGGFSDGWGAFPVA